MVYPRVFLLVEKPNLKNLDHPKMAISPPPPPPINFHLQIEVEITLSFKLENYYGNKNLSMMYHFCQWYLSFYFLPST